MIMINLKKITFVSVLIVLLTLCMSIGVSAYSDEYYSNCTDMYSVQSYEYYINGDDEDRLYRIDLSDMSENMIYNEHIISLVGKGNNLYMLVYEDGNSKLIELNTDSLSKTVLCEFKDLVTNMSVRDNVIYYIENGSVYTFDLNSHKSKEFLHGDAINFMVITDYNTLKYYTKFADSQNYDEKTYKFDGSDIDANIELMASSYTPRLEAPSTTNPYYTTLNVFHTSGYGMVGNNGNCTCYAYGRSYENLDSKPKLSTANAENWYNYNKNNGFYSYGKTPYLGAVAVWSKGVIGNSSDGAGHVAVVEVINGDTVTTSESGWKSFYFKTYTRSASHSNFSYSSSYSFQGFIYVCGKIAQPDAVKNVKVQVNGQNVNVSWSGASNATHYDVYLVQSPWGWGDIKYSKSTQTTSCTFPNIPSGKYCAFVISRPNSDSTQSEWVGFNVYDSAPKAPTIEANCLYATKGTTVTISWNKTSNTQNYIYYLTEYPEGYAYTTNTFSEYVSSESVSFSNLSPGKYSIFVHSVNSYSWSEQSNWVSFYIYEKEYVPSYTSIYNGHIYAVYDYEMSWSFARDLCKDMGGHLATVTSNDENEFLQQLIDNGNKDAYWIGATNINEADGKFKWVTNEEFVYSSWADGEPSNSGEDGEKEHFAEIRKSYSYKWNDVNNINKSNKGFVVEIEPDQANVTASSEYGGNRYVLIDRNITWTEAAKYCELLGGHLVTIDSVGEKRFINDFIKNGKREWYYLGARKSNDEWKWLNNTNVTLLDWGENASNWDGLYLMEYKSHLKCIPFHNVYFPEKDISSIGFICEIETKNACIETRIVDEQQMAFSIGAELFNVDLDCTIIIAKYNGNELVGSELRKYAGEEEIFPVFENVDTVKIFAVDDVQMLKPICKSASLKID